MVKYIQIFKPGLPRQCFWLLNVWLPIILLPGSVFVVPFALYNERRLFFRPYPESEMREIAEAIADKCPRQADSYQDILKEIADNVEVPRWVG
jgi:hypothetical protein